MRLWITRVLVGGVALASAAGGSSVALAAHPSKHHVRHHHARVHRAAETTREAPESTSATDGDGAQQAAACQGLGDNVNYDDATGTCTVDNGGQSGTQR